MGCCGSKNDAEEPHYIKPKQPQTKQNKITGKGIQIGGGQTEQAQPINQNEKIAEAAEKRLQALEKRGMNPQSKIEFDLRKRKLEEAEQYEKERRGETYNLRWNN